MFNIASKVWQSFVDELIAEVDKDYLDDSAEFSWKKSDGSRVTGLDLRLDAKIRILISRHFPDLAVLTEETGYMSPTGRRGSRAAIVDPVDGTDSLIKKAASWWVSIGIIDNGSPLAGLIYQPTVRRVHDSRKPSKRSSADLIIGLSPDKLKSSEDAELRARLTESGAKLVSTPHAVEKVASVLEGRCAAVAYLPSQKSPMWHPWDLAACIAIAAANEILLTTLDGEPLRVDTDRTDRSDSWICAANRESWDIVRHSIS